MVVAISLAYVTYGGLWWMQALFYAIGATVIAIIAIAAYKLARSTNKHDPLLWGIFVLLTAVTVWAQAELAESSSWRDWWSCWCGRGQAGDGVCSWDWGA